MAKFQLEDFTGTVEVTCFPKDYIKSGYKIREDLIMMVEGHINEEGNKYSVNLNTVNGLEELEENKFLNLYVLIDDETREMVNDLKRLLIRNKGNNQIFLAIAANNKREVIKLNKKYNVNLSRKFIGQLIKMIGIKKIKIR